MASLFFFEKSDGKLVEDKGASKVCANDQFTCANGEYGCISLSLKCNGISECMDQSDEKDCPKWPGCRFGPDDEVLKKTNSKGKYPQIVNASGDIIYPGGEKNLKFGMQKIIFFVTLILGRCTFCIKMRFTFM